MVLFAIPIFLGNLFQQFYNTFDSWCVGNFIGEDALAAVSSSGSLIFMMVGFFNGVAMGAGVIIARFFGAGDTDSLKKAIHTDVAFGLVSGGLLTVLGVVFTPMILGWMGTPEDVMPQSVAYFRYYFCGAIFTVLYNIFVGILHALGDSRTPLYYLILASFVNVVLDLLFVAVLGMGVGAAAVATTISQGLSAVLCAIRLMRLKTDYRLKVKEIRFHRKSLRQIIQYGLPAGIQNSVIAFANVVVQSNINSFGKAAMAGCGSYSKIEGFAFLPITCFTQALATFVGQNLGAGNVKRVKKGVGFGILCPAVIAELIGVILWLTAPKLIGIFNDDALVIDFGTRHMRTIAPFFFLLATTHCISSVLRGAGKTTLPMVTLLAVWCIFRVSYVTVAVRYVNRLETISWAYPITWTISSVILLICFFKSDWLHHFQRQEEKQNA
ncbi:MAG: MATE family efflux transporter [Oscillospiraceae bacterium]|nr:MATE family efflux transporter [Oscillospiraceae bacterium]